MTIFDVYPWQNLSHFMQHNKELTHAYLFHGMAGIGKFQFAQAVAASLVCENPQRHMACQRCQSCHLARLGNHPDLRFLMSPAQAAARGLLPEIPAEGKLSNQISIDQVHELDDFFTVSTHCGQHRVLIVNLVETMNVYSSNAILKILEEPPAKTVFLLIANSLDRILPTIISRCRRYPMGLPSAHLAIQWLEAQGVSGAERYLRASSGAPLTAYEMAQENQSETDLVEQFNQLFWTPLYHGQHPQYETLLTTCKGRVADTLAILQRFLMDIALQQRHLPAQYYPSYEKQLRPLSERVNASKLMSTFQWLKQEQAFERKQIKINENMQLLAILQRVGVIFHR